MISRARSGIVNGGSLLAVFAFVALLAGSTHAAGIADLRVGDHADYTRVVLELDQPTGYRLVVPREGGPAEVVMQVNASGKALQLATKSPLVREVTITPAERGSTIRIALSTASVQVSEMILSQPARIVLDLRPSGPMPTAAAKPPAPAAPVVAKVEEPKQEAAAAPSLREEAAEKAASESPQLPATMPPGDAATSAAADAAPPTVLTDEIALAAAASSETQPSNEMGDAMADGVQAAELASDPPAAAPRPPVIKTAKRAAPEPAETGSWLTPPVMVGVGVFLLVMVSWVLMRRRRSEDDDPLFPVISADDVDGEEVWAQEESDASEAEAEPAAMAAAEDWETEDAATATEPIPVTSGNGMAAPPQVSVESEQMNLGESPTPVEEPEADDSIFAAVEAVQAETAEVAPAGFDEGLAKRIHELEARLESLVESRERLERQVAAQTEELRVQRAAIARTQRVVRTMSKGEEEASEPVPRPPN